MWLPETEKVLNIISKEDRIKDYVFVGGSALSFYLNHRLSEDIDLASPNEFLKMDGHIDKIMSNIFNKGFNVEESVESSAHSASKRIFYINDVKVEFWASIENNFLSTERTSLKNNLNIANLDTLIGMKTAVIHHREVIRDYYDIYVITKEFGLEKAINEADRLYNKKVNGLEYFKFDETDFFKYAVNLKGVESEGVDSELAPKYKVNRGQIESFLREEIEKYTINKFNRIEKELSQPKPENNPKYSVNPQTPKPDAFAQDVQNRQNKQEIKRKFGR
jgi:hypothetical protein